MYRDSPPVRHMVHYEVRLERDRMLEPEDFGLGGELAVPEKFQMEIPFRINLSLALYKTAMLLKAEMLEVENHPIYKPGTQKNFENFLEHHTLKYGWEYPRAMNISWRLDCQDFRGNMVCVASKYDGVTDMHEPDVTILGQNGIVNKDTGVSLGVDPITETETFEKQFLNFEPLFHAALVRSCMVAGGKVHVLP